LNFLAHIYLSGKDPNIVVGNFIGDFVKGKELEEYDKGIRTGIILHRKIDHFTDNHAIVKESKKRLRLFFHHYAPVIVDVFYDHFLASHWQDYHDENLKNFTEKFYELIDQYNSQLPKKAQHMLSFMIPQNWLYQYQYIDGINRALTGMSRRTSFDSKMELASKELEKNSEAYYQEFVAFFPELIAMCQGFISSHHD
jgi:acyl carrier protein phosphodiesterase